MGNVKALIPVLRERQSLEYELNEPQKVRYKRGEKSFIKEKRIFGVLTPH